MEQERENEVMGSKALDDFFNETSSETPPVEQKPNNEPPTQDVEVSTEEVEQESSPQVNNQNDYNPYSDLINDYIAKGSWQDVSVEIEGEEEPVPITELKNLTKEQFLELTEKQEELRNQDYKENYISKKGLSETDLKLIEIKKQGGDITPLLQEHQQRVHPLQGLDLDDEQTQIELVVSKRRHQKIPDYLIETEIKKLREDMTLDIAAKEIVDEVNQSFEATVSQELEAQKKLKEESQQKQKEFKKKILEVNRKFGLNDSRVKTLTDLASKQGDDGITEGDRLFFSAKENPEHFAEVMFLLSDPEGYRKMTQTKAKTAVTKETLGKVISINSTKKKTGEDVNRKSPLDEFFNEP